MRDILVNAIKQMYRLKIFYDPGIRFVEPHVIGHGSSGQMLLRAFQVEGASESGEHTAWKLFLVDRIYTATVLPEQFSEPRLGYNPDDSAMKGGIIVRVPKAH